MYYKWVRFKKGSGVVVRKMGKNVLGFGGILVKVGFDKVDQKSGKSYKLP